MHIENGTGWIVAEQGQHAGYVRNLQADPDVRVRIARRWRPARAIVVAEDDANNRLDTSNRPRHAAAVRRFGGSAVRRFGTELATVRVDLLPMTLGAPGPGAS